MEKLPIVLRKFVQEVSAHHSGDRPLTINDLRLAIRDERMAEIREWSIQDLDGIELQAARFDGDAPLESVLSVAEDAATEAACVSSIPSPSPFAWT